jgi:nucleotide-binding universal stress UspA family protein
MEKQAAVCACPLTKGERILVGVDGSECSEKALDQAISLGKMCNSALFAISVVDLYPETLAVAPELEEKMSSEAREILQRAKDKVAKENMACQTIVHIGAQPHKFIVQEAKEKDIDLIVLGIHGRTGLKKLLIGSVAERVIGHAPCAVMVTPA